MAKTEFFIRGKIIRLLSLYFGVALAVMACEDDVDPTVDDPTINIFFMNRDSLNEVTIITDSLNKELASYDSIIAVLEDSADLLVDSLIVLTDSIDNGGDLEEDSTFIANKIVELNIGLELIEMEDAKVNSQSSFWESVGTVISSGSVQVESILNTRNGQKIFYEDSSTTWKLPLDMQSDDIDIDISLGGQTFNLALGYSRTTAADEKNKVVISTSDFEIISTDFKNPYLSCNGCEASKTTVYVEF